MDNLQTEVLEIEFLTYSKGMTTISEEDFAKILLRFTNVENISAYLENVRQCIPDEKVRSFFFLPVRGSNEWTRNSCTKGGKLPRRFGFIPVTCVQTCLRGLA